MALALSREVETVLARALGAGATLSVASSVGYGDEEARLSPAQVLGDRELIEVA